MKNAPKKEAFVLKKSKEVLFLEEKLAKARQITKQDPKLVSHIIKDWIAKNAH